MPGRRITFGHRKIHKKTGYCPNLSTDSPARADPARSESASLDVIVQGCTFWSIRIVMNPAFAKAWKPFIILLAMITIGCCVRWACIASKSTPSHDECISYLAACGNQGLYALSPPSCQWHSIADIHRFYEMNPQASLRHIRDDLAQYDIHPPLYFWLLRSWITIWGISSHSGPALNLVFVFLSAMGLFLLGQKIFSSTNSSLLAVFIWIFSPMVASISLDARQYELFGTLSIYYLLLVLDFSRCHPGVSIWKLALLGLITTAGLLTHFYFAILISGAGFYLMTRTLSGISKNSDGGESAHSISPCRLLCFGGVTLAGILLFLVINPEFLNSFSNQRSQSVPYSISGLVTRIGKTVRCLAGFFVYPKELIVLFLGLASVAVLPLGYYWKSIQQAFRNHPSILRPGCGWFLATLSGWYGGWTILLFLSFITPGMGGRYLSPFWPMFSLGLTALLYRAGLHRSSRMAPLLVLYLALGAGGLWYGYRQDPERQPLPALEAHWLLVDSVQRGCLPRVTWNLEKDLAVYACSQDDILSASAEWSSHLPEGIGLYAAVKMYNSPAKSLLILDKLKKGHTVEQVCDDWLDLVDFYRVRPLQP